MRKRHWIDPRMDRDLIDIFVRYGRQIEVSRGDVLLGTEERPGSFYYVEHGVLAAFTESNRDGRVPVKIIPEGRAFGFTLYSFPPLDRYALISLGSGSVRELLFEAMNVLEKGDEMDLWSFDRYSEICRTVTANTFCASFKLPYDKRDSNLYAAALLNSFEGIFENMPGRLKITPADLCLFKYADMRKSTLPGKETPENNKAADFKEYSWTAIKNNIDRQ